MRFISKIKQFVLLLPVMAGMAFFQSCTEEIDTSSRYTFTGNTIISYRRNSKSKEKHSETLLAMSYEQ